MCIRLECDGIRSFESSPAGTASPNLLLGTASHTLQFPSSAYQSLNRALFSPATRDHDIVTISYTQRSTIVGSFPPSFYPKSETAFGWTAESPMVERVLSGVGETTCHFARSGGKGETARSGRCKTGTTYLGTSVVTLQLWLVVFTVVRDRIRGSRSVTGRWRS
jgi:hypothetical protein